MEFVKLSKRLRTVADMVTKGSVVADIGTDHGYLPIYLVQNDISRRVIAMDVNKGPLNKANQNIKQLKLQDRIETRLSDGLVNLKNGEVNTITICGMGGKLMARILEAGIEKISSANELILSPQSEIYQFREYLLKRNFKILNEDMFIDEGKFYVIIKCKLQEPDLKAFTQPAAEPAVQLTAEPAVQLTAQPAAQPTVQPIAQPTAQPAAQPTVQPDLAVIKLSQNSDSAIADDVALKYGRYLLEHKNEALKKYLVKEYTKYQKVRENVMNSNSENIEGRIKELDYELRCIEEGLNYYEM